MNSRIALFIGDLSIGGAERVTVNLANQLAENGYQVEVVVISIEGELTSDLADDVQVSVLPVNRMRWAVIPLAKHLRNSSPDVLISFLTPTNIIAILASKLSLMSHQIIVTEHGKKIDSDLLSTRRDIMLAKHLYKAADDIIGVSKGVSEDIAAWANVNPTKITTIYNPVIEDKLISDNSSYTEFDFDTEDGNIILGAGRHVKQKDFKTLILSFKKLLDEYPNSHLIIIGEGELTTEYKELTRELNIQESVSFPGYVDDPFQYMRTADVFGLSSKWEGLSLVIIEAMACGTPVVSTDCPSGPAEVLKDGQYGELVPVGDSEAMSNALKKTLENPSSTKYLRDRARDFSVEKSTKQYENLFRTNRGSEII